MNEDALRKGIRSGGCRLCLAPDTECVPIFATAAADKEPLSHKILSCVNIKVSDKAANSYYTSMSLSIHPPIYQSLRDSAKSAHIWCVGETRTKREIYPKNSWDWFGSARATHFIRSEPRHDDERKKWKYRVEIQFFFHSAVRQSSSHRRGRWLSISVASQSMYGMSYVCQLGSINRK